MADTNTTKYGFTKPEVGASSDTWGAKLNTGLDDLDALLGATATTGSANAYVLTTGLSLAAYVDGQSWLVRASFANTGGATIAVDGLLAKNLRKMVGGVLTALASGDINSGDYLRLVYNLSSDVVVIVGGIGQPLDATLTALAALAWSSGSPVVQFTAADTVSLTLTPSVTSVTATNSGAAASLAAVNSSAAVVLELERTDAHGNVTINNIEFYGRDSGAAKQLYGRSRMFVADNTAGSEDGQLVWGVTTGGTYADELALLGSALFPIANDGLALGFGSIAFSDLFLASGAVIGIGNGNFTLTHSTGLLSASGPIQARIPTSTETTGTLTAASANKKITATGGITIPASVMTTDDAIVIDGGGTARTITRGASLTMYVNGVDSATGTLTANGVMGVHFRSATVCILTGNVS